MLEFADDTRNSLIIYKTNTSINMVLIRGKSNYILEKKILFQVKFEHNMIKSKNSMNILNKILSKLEHQIGNNDLLEIERQRGFVKKQEVNETDLNFEDEIDDEQQEESNNLW